jgi:hypothetical protein
MAFFGLRHPEARLHRGLQSRFGPSIGTSPSRISFCPAQENGAATVRVNACRGALLGMGATKLWSWPNIPAAPVGGLLIRAS